MFSLYLRLNFVYFAHTILGNWTPKTFKPIFTLKSFNHNILLRNKNIFKKVATRKFEVVGNEILMKQEWIIIQISLRLKN